MGEKVRQKGKNGGKSLEGTEVNWEVNLKQVCHVPVFKVHPRKSGSCAGDNAGALIKQTVERKQRLCTYVGAADFKKTQQCQGLVSCNLALK